MNRRIRKKREKQQLAQALDLIKVGGKLVRTATWEVIPPSRP